MTAIRFLKRDQTSGSARQPWISRHRSTLQTLAQAAQSTAEFVERAGSAKQSSKKKDSNAVADLRVRSFRQQRAGPDGKLHTYEMDIRVLSLLPIPVLQIKNAELDFAVRMREIRPTGKPNTRLARTAGGKGNSETESATGRGEDLQNFLTVPRVEMKAELDRT